MLHSSLWHPEQYQLLDFGDARKLERFGPLVLDRPSPAAERSRPRAPALWQHAQVKLSHQGSIKPEQYRLPSDWCVRYGAITMRLHLTPFGHVGLFPEHAANWDWLIKRFAQMQQRRPDAPVRVLNLFAYTGGASLVSAVHGCQVVHVDSSAPSVAWARANAALSSLAAAPIRWIVDDARAFVARELRRGRRYEAIILDPPSYGHGLKGNTWHIERDLVPLLSSCCQLLAPNDGSALVVTGHSETLSGASIDFDSLLLGAGRHAEHIETGRLAVVDPAERSLDSGWFARLIIASS